jgi:hypothetical protein
MEAIKEIFEENFKGALTEMNVQDVNRVCWKSQAVDIFAS